MAQDDRLTGQEIEAVRQAFARFRVLAARTEEPAEGRRLLAFCRCLMPTGSPAFPLSEREVDVLAQAAVGLHNREIAGALGLGPETVKSYLRSAMSKLGAQSRQSAVRAARRAGLLP